MIVRGRTSLGWKQLTHRPARFATAAAGVGFAVILVFMQLGFMNMMFDSSVMLHHKLNADIVLLSSTARGLVNAGTFPRRRLAQALATNGVADGESLYLTNRDWIKKSDDMYRGDRGTMMLIGVTPDFPAFRDAEITAQQPLLVETGTALFDRQSRGDYSTFAAAIARGARPQTELSGRTVTLVGSFSLGSSFSVEGVIIVSDQTFFEYAINRSPAAPSVGLIKVSPGFDPAEVAEHIQQKFAGYDDTKVMTMQKFIEYSRARLQRDSPIAFVFTFGIIIGAIVGIVVVVQILSADVHDHLSEYATLKAIGFTNRALLGIVFEQSLILSIAGFIPGLLISLGLYAIGRAALTMPIGMPIDRVFMVLGIAIAMCVISGAVVMRRVRTANPADVF